MEEKIDAIMKALEFLLHEQGYYDVADALYKARSNYNPEDE